LKLFRTSQLYLVYQDHFSHLLEVSDGRIERFTNRVKLGGEDQTARGHNQLGFLPRSLQASMGLWASRRKVVISGQWSDGCRSGIQEIACRWLLYSY